MSPLSVVIITFNEEKNIARCLQSVLDVADDIVVVDSFSSDGTERICRSMNIRFVQHAFAGHIEQKNWAITQAKFPFILSLDADEVLSPELINSVTEIKKSGSKDGYYMNRLNNYCGKWIKHGGWYPDKKLRLWDSTKGKWGGVNPHDKFEMNAGDQSTGFLKGDLLHYSFHTVDEHKRRAKQFAEISALALFKMGKKSSLIKKYFSPPVKFIKDYFFRLGFLDGYFGFMISVISAQSVYHRIVTMQRLEKGISK